MLLWKKDGEEIFVPKISSVDFEYNIKQLPVLNTNVMFTELINDIVSNLSEIIYYTIQVK